VSEESLAIRAFLALPVPPEVITKLQALQTKLSKVLDDVAWTRPESLHLTIRFFGNVACDRIEELQKTIRQVCPDFPSFRIRAAKAGCFGERVIWVGVSGASPRLQELADRINEATRGFGKHEEKREFRPHLTIGRMKKGRAGRISVAERLTDWAGTEFGEWTVDHLDLMRSELLSQGARYTCLEKYPLQGALVSERQPQNVAK
jgi:RNA 2',3'-cyclic 3'-phosphodiesterase